jgi:DNA-directed RNA polymerase I subunit RPA1
MIKNLMEDIEKDNDTPKAQQKVQKKTKKNEESKNEEILLIKEEDDEGSIDDDMSIQDLIPKEERKESDSKIEIEGDLIANIPEAPKEPVKRPLLTSDSENSLLKLSTFGGSKLDLVFHLPFNMKRTLFIPIVEQLLEKVSIREIQGIKRLHLINLNSKDSQPMLQTEGLNFGFAWSLPDIFDVSKIESNDVQEVSRVYGIEAGRNCLAKEVLNVFSHYGITVDFRHMSLVADHMSFSGELRPLSRTGMQYAQSPILKMSFETSMNFLIKACENKDYDNLNTASGNIVVGELMKNGTGAFDIIECQS